MGDLQKKVFSAENTPKDQPDSYRYVMMHMGQEVEIGSVTPPDELLRVMSTFAQLLGFRWEELSITVYSRTREGEVWQAIHGADVAESVLFPLPSHGKVALKENDYYNIGRAILNSYVVMRDWTEQLRASELNDKGKVLLVDLEDKMRVVESVVEGTKMAKLFELKYQQRLKGHVCAAKLHISPRTCNRKVHAMAVYIGQVLHATLKPRILQELMRISDGRLGNIS